MPNSLEKVVILYSWKKYLVQYWPFLGLTAIVLHFGQSPNWPDAIGLFLAGALCLAMILEGLSRRYIIIDSSGIFCALWTSRRSWSQFEACAYKNDNRQQILRIYYNRKTTNIQPTVDCKDATTFSRERSKAPLDMKSKPETFLEIDFNETANPAQSVEKAFQACFSWIVATGVPHPIRPFVDDLPTRTTTFRAPKVKSIALALIILSAPFSILLQYTNLL